MVAKEINLIIIIIVIVVSFLGCSHDKPEKISFFFSRVRHKNNDILINKGEFELRKLSSKNSDSISLFRENIFLSGYKEKMVKGKGIFNDCNGHFVLTHSFTDTTNRSGYCLSAPPFLNKHVLLIDSKYYDVSGKRYKIYHYAEHNNNDSNANYDSFFLENIGFICYYNFDRDDYIICDSTNIRDLPIKQIGHLLVKDSSFFARYTLTKLFPNYYRVP